MNPLPIIRLWLETKHPDDDPTRTELERWVGDSFPGVDLSLAVDCLIVVGIGREVEQEGTVCCQASRLTI